MTIEEIRKENLGFRKNRRILLDYDLFETVTHKQKPTE